MRAALLAFALLLAATPGRSEPWRATYTVTAAGLPVFEAEIHFELAGPRYAVESRVRARGLARLILTGEQVARSIGSWRGAEARPARHESEGNWRGAVRRTRLEYGADGAPRILELLPAKDMPRSPVPVEATGGTVDTLSAMATLVRRVRDGGQCATRARSFDGRRLAELEAAAAAEPAPAAQLRCVIETRALAGYALDRDPEEARGPFRVTVLFGEAAPGAPVIPLHVELPSRWWGRIEARLTSLTPG